MFGFLAKFALTPFIQRRLIKRSASATPSGA
jgi:hypothetical protein